uniref:netrin-G1-like isoform X2 n=1 Tax=Myxine glutinosa TaxID=7769 RepID=UPI00358E3577
MASCRVLMLVLFAMPPVPALGLQDEYNRCVEQERHERDGRSLGVPRACRPAVLELVRYARFRLDPPNVTCGNPSNKFCRLENEYMCGECDSSTPELSHPPSLMFDADRYTTFWQSVTWQNNLRPFIINITLSWGKSVELTDDIVITFESHRPSTMILQRSMDHGHTWHAYQLYAKDCLKTFGMRSASILNLSANSSLKVICTEVYSSKFPSKEAQVVRFEVYKRLKLHSGPSQQDPATLYNSLESNRVLRNFFTLTDLRICLLEPAIWGDFVDQRNLNKYYYAISDVQIRGRCQCNLHANECEVGEDGILGCVCQHNTTGRDCKQCRTGVWSRGSYLPYPRGTANGCTECICNGHSSRCSYIDQLNLLVCVSCQDHTRGHRCQECQQGYYRNVSAPINASNACIDCACDLFGAVHDHCDDSGQCQCKEGTTGLKCNQCEPGFHWHRGCQLDVCDDGFLQCQNGGDCQGGRCICLPEFSGLRCERRGCHGSDGALCHSEAARSQVAPKRVVAAAFGATFALWTWDFGRRSR